MHLLAQIVVPLALVDVLLDLLGNFVLQLENLQFFRKQLHRQLQPLHGVRLFEKLLLIRIRNRTVLPDEVRNETCVVRRNDLQEPVLQIFCRQIDKLLIRPMCLPQKRLHSGVRFVVRGHLDFFHARKKIGLGLDAVDHLRARLTFNEDAHIIARQAKDLLDNRDGTDGVEIAFLGVVYA